MRKPPSGLRDRVLAAIEIPALGIWLGALAGLAFVSAPLAFHIVAPLDAGRFAELTARSIGILTVWGYVLGGIAALAGALRSVMAGDRSWDFARVALVLVALGLAAYEQHAIVPAMQRTADFNSAAYHALHGQSTLVYGAVTVLALVALVLAAVRRDD